MRFEKTEINHRVHKVKIAIGRDGFKSPPWGGWG